MTKRVRVLNGDGAKFVPVVQIWDKGYPAGQPDTLVREIPLHNPGDVTGDDVYITSSRYLVIKEQEAPPKA